MSSGFLIADALSSVLRKPYHKADMAITVSYLVEGIKIGAYRVMLKRNFDTACWIPPVGKRTSHSIYYGDRMVGRVMERFVQMHELPMPDEAEFVAQVQAALASEKAERAAVKAAAGSPSKKPSKLPKVNPMARKTRVLDAKLQWLKDNASDEQWAIFGEWLHKAIQSYGRHERAHALNTPQDLKKVNADLKVLGIPFQYFNLFEDARIEHIDRKAQGSNFDWMVFEDLAPSDHPMNMFLRCIQLEGVRDDLSLENESPFKGDPALRVSDVADSVLSYYVRACECPTAEHLYPIITEFLEEFKEDLPPPSKGKASGSGGGSSSPSGEEEDGGEGESEDDDEDSGAEERAGDLSTAAEAADKGDDFFKDFDEDTEIVGGTDKEGKAAEEAAKDALKGKSKAPDPKGDGSTKSGSGLPESVEPTGAGGRGGESDFLTKKAGQIDDVYQNRVDNLTNMLMRMFKTHSLPAALEAPAQRMSSRHLAHGQIRFLHKRVFGGKGKRKFTIVFDCSGSMGGRPSREGKLLLLAFNNLAKRGFLEGSLILSGYVGGAPSWLNYTFPVKDDIIMRIAPSHGSEGLQTALAQNLKSIKGMDDVFVVTDANICDTPIKREQFARERVWPVGLYAGSEEVASEMEKHFPQNIIRDTIEQVVEAMLIRNRRTVG